MTEILLVPSPKPGFVDRLQAALGAFVSPDRLKPASNDNQTVAVEDYASSLADPLALPPDWHAAGDLLSLNFLPFDR